MAERTLVALVREDEEHPEMLLVSSPVVGMADGAPRAEVFLNALDQVVSIKILGERYVLRLPRDRHGRVVEALIPNEYTPVQYDQPLARLDPRALQADRAAGPAGAAAAAGAGEGRADRIVVKAPSEGIFYRRPSPDAAPYVDVGASVSAGTVLGLVEVMKCFNQITYGGPEFPAQGKIAKVLVEDTAEVAFGQPLFQIEPVEG